MLPAVLAIVLLTGCGAPGGALGGTPSWLHARGAGPPEGPAAAPPPLFWRRDPAQPHEYVGWIETRGAKDASDHPLDAREVAPWVVEYAQRWGCDFVRYRGEHDDFACGVWAARVAPPR
jgi:hypothetical protein